MSYTTLKKAFHNPSIDADELYHKRFSAEGTIHIDLLIAGYPAFCILDDAVYRQMLAISKADKKILALSQSLPGRAIQQFTERTLIDEIVLTNGIEGVNSSKKEIGDILRHLETRNKRKRFYGLVNKYAMLGRGVEMPLRTLEDIRTTYDDLVLDEVKSDRPDNEPDGALFRKSPVSVYNAAGQEIHQGISPERRIGEYLNDALTLLNDNGVEILVRTAIFHYLMGYIHPFYDGNGRLNRFISSYLLSREYEPLVGFRLSFAVTQSIDTYYKGFATCNDPLNKGDLTPFVLMFLDIVRQAVEEIVSALSEKEALLDENLERMRRVAALAKDRDFFELGSVLLQARMFSGDGITVQDLMALFDITRPTVMKRLARIADTGLLEREKVGREVHFQIDLDALERASAPIG